VQYNTAPLSESQIKALSDFGLTATQSKLYLSLNIIGASSVKDITEFSNTPRQDVYRVLNELFEIGLVEKEITTPTQYRAIPINDCLNLLTERLTKKTKEIQLTAHKTLNHLTKNLPLKKEPCKIILVPNKEPIALKSRDLLNSVQENLMVISPPNKLFPWLFEQKCLFQKALKRNVKLRLITKRPANEKALQQTIQTLNENSNFKIKYLPQTPAVSFSLYDTKRIILELSAKEGYTKSQAIICENSSLIELASSYFELNWCASKLS